MVSSLVNAAKRTTTIRLLSSNISRNRCTCTISSKPYQPSVTIRLLRELRPCQANSSTSPPSPSVFPQSCYCLPHCWLTTSLSTTPQQEMYQWVGGRGISLIIVPLYVPSLVYTHTHVHMLPWWCLLWLCCHGDTGELVGEYQRWMVCGHGSTNFDPSRHPVVHLHSLSSLGSSHGGGH